MSVHRITFLIRSLQYGGAERQLVELARGLATRGHRVTVLVCYPGGALEAELAGSGVAIHSLNKRGRWDLPGFILRLVRAIRRSEAEVVHGYATVPNLFVSLIRPLVRPCRIVWGVRASDVPPDAYDEVVHGTLRLLDWMAPTADLIIANSSAGAARFLARPSIANRVVVISNGVDTGRFAPRGASVSTLRAAWGIAPEAPLIGIVARLHPMKGHSVFLQAAARAIRQRAELRFVVVGDGAADYQDALRRQASTLGLNESLGFVPARADVPEVYRALDLLCSASIFGEGFSNVLGEAMACGVPCVATDVGDARTILSDLGAVVAPNDPQALSDALLHMLERRSSELTARCRARIVEQFSIERLVRTTERVLGWPHG